MYSAVAANSPRRHKNPMKATRENEYATIALKILARGQSADFAGSQCEIEQVTSTTLPPLDNKEVGVGGLPPFGFKIVFYKPSGVKRERSLRYIVSHLVKNGRAWTRSNATGMDDPGGPRGTATTTPRGSAAASIGGGPSRRPIRQRDAPSTGTYTNIRGSSSNASC